MFFIQLCIWQFLYSDDYDDNYIDDHYNNSAGDQCDNFVYMWNFIVFITYHIFVEIYLCIVWYNILVWKELWMPPEDMFWEGWISVLCMWKGVQYKEGPMCTQEEKPHRWCMLCCNCCIECKLYEFLIYMIYIWTKNILWFISFCTLL